MIRKVICIRIETDTSGYAIGGVLSQLSADWVTPEANSTKANFSASESDSAKSKKSAKSDFGQWHPVAYFSRKMIPAETRYKTHNGELLAIVEAFKTWRHYLMGCKYEVLVLTDHNNLCRFMDTKSLSFRQGKANGAVDALSRFPQRSIDEKKLQTKNTQILHRLQTLLTSASLSGLNTNLSPKTNLSPLHRVLICGTHVLPQLRQFWTDMQTELASRQTSL